MKRVQRAMVLLGVFVIFLGFIGTVSAVNLTVNPGDSIQSAVDNASSGDTTKRVIRTAFGDTEE